ncbi:MAG: DUF2271 domain-containing protein, partial [Planctomycetota bacterium]|nr:DUF2271 domain-containing protein [Planctomycetota bacterium]
EALKLSRELYDFLREAASIQKKSKGAFNVGMGELVKLWAEAPKKGKEPSSRKIDFALKGVKAGFRVWKRKKAGRFLERRGDIIFQLDAIAKGYIIDKAARAAMKSKGCGGLKLDIGGEILVLGSFAQNIDIANPQRSEDNAKALTTVRLKNLSIATSGGYERPLKIGGKTYSHILDPRTGRPASGVLSATVICASNATADALATTLCVLSPKAGIELIEKHTDAVALIIDKDGKQYRSHGFRGFELNAKPEKDAPKSAWPAKHEVILSFKLINSWETVNRPRKRRKFKRHFVASWVEDMEGRRVRLLALWADRGELKYLKDLNDFWKFGWTLAGEDSDPRSARSISKATRRPGRYRLLWDGLDDSGKALPQGKYVLRLDVNRENGPPNSREGHTSVSLPIECGAKGVTVTAKDQPELGSVKAVYGPSKRK